MSPEQIKTLTEKAKADPKFLHSLIFDPSRAVEQIDSLDARSKESLLNLDPVAIIALAAGEFSACGGSVTCSCTSGTCAGVTCGGSTCDVTCSGDSCGNTCGNSCGYTTDFVSRLEPDIADWHFPAIRKLR